jgi:hypothetical protein
LEMVSKLHKGCATDFQEPRNPNLPKLLGFNQTRRKPQGIMASGVSKPRKGRHWRNAMPVSPLCGLIVVLCPCTWGLRRQAII